MKTMYGMFTPEEYQTLCDARVLAIRFYAAHKFGSDNCNLANEVVIKLDELIAANPWHYVED